MEDSAREMFHSENISRVDIDAIVCDSVNKNESEEKDSLGELVNVEKLSSDIVEIGPTNSEIVHPNLYESENETEKVDTVDLPVDELVKAQIEIPSDSVLKTLSGITEKDIPASEIETVLENVTSCKFEVESLEGIDSVTSETDLEKREEVTHKSPDSSEIDESKEVDSKAPIESEIRKIDKENSTRVNTCDTARQSEENESIGDSSIDTENKQMEIISGIDDTEIEKKESITEGNSKLIINDSAINTESKIILEVTPIQNSAPDSSLATEFEKEKKEDLLHMETLRIEGEDSDGSEKQSEIDDSSETTMKIDKIQCPNLLRTDIECSTGNTGLQMESEVRSAVTIGLDEETSEISIQKSDDNTELKAIVDEPECSVSCDKLLEATSETDVVVHENPPEIISKSIIEEEGSQEIDSETKTVEVVPTFSESGGELEEENLSLGSGGELEGDNLLSVKLVDENNSEVDANICPLDENLGSGEMETLRIEDKDSDGSETQLEIDDSSETIMKIDKIQCPNLLRTDIECSTGNTGLKMESEVRSAVAISLDEETSEISIQKSEDNTDSKATLDEPECSVSCDKLLEDSSETDVVVHENPPEIISESIIEEEGSQEIDSETETVEVVPTFSESGGDLEEDNLSLGSGGELEEDNLSLGSGELEGDNLLSVELVDENNSEVETKTVEVPTFLESGGQLEEENLLLGSGGELEEDNLSLGSGGELDGDNLLSVELVDENNSEVETKTVEVVPTCLESGGELEEDNLSLGSGGELGGDNLLSVKLVDENNSEVVANICPLDENLGSGEVETVRNEGDDSDGSEKQLEIDDSSETIIKIDKIQCPNLFRTDIECSTGNTGLKMESEVRSAVTIGLDEETSEISIQKSEDNTDSKATLDEPECSVSCDKLLEATSGTDVVVHENPPEIISKSIIEEEGSQEIGSETKTVEVVPTFSESGGELEEENLSLGSGGELGEDNLFLGSGGELEEDNLSLGSGGELEGDNLLSVELVDENNSEVVASICPLDENLGSGEMETLRIEDEDSDGSEKQLEIDDSSETIMKIDKIQCPNLLRTDIEYSTGNTGLKMKSEVRSAVTIGLDEETSEISIQKSEDNTDSKATLDEPECSVSCDKLLEDTSETDVVVHKKPPEIISKSIIEEEGSQEIDSETKTVEVVPTFSESGGELEEDNLSLGSGGELEGDNLLSVKLVDENNSEVVANICPLDENLGSGEVETVRIEGKDSDGSEKQLEIDDGSKTIMKIDKIQCPNLLRTDIECSTGNTGLKMESEVRSAVAISLDEETSVISIQKSEDNTDLKATLDEPECSVSCDKLLEDSSETDVVVHENPPEIISESIIEEEGSQEIDSETKTVEVVPTFLESGGKLEEDNLSLGSGGGPEGDNLLSVELVDENNSEVVANICPLDENLGSGEIPSADNEVENVPEEIISDFSREIGPMLLETENLLESQVKLDVDLKCEPIEDLDKLAVVADEILIDELASSVLKEGVQSLESLNDLEILPDDDLPTSAIINTEELKIPEVKAEFSETKIEPASLLEEMNDSCFIAESNQAPSASRGADYITDVILSSTNLEDTQLADNIEGIEDEIATAEGFVVGDSEDLLKTTEDLVPKISVSIDENIVEIEEVCKLQIDESLILSKDVEIDLPLKQEEEEEEKLIESAVLGECDVKIDLPTDVLFDADDAEQMDVLCSTSADNVDTSQQSSEISELECAVKFLQESEEQTIDSPLLLSPEIAEDIVEENSEQSKSCLFLPETEVCQDSLELATELEEITPNSMAISEAEIISEAAKLESERKLKIAEELSKSSEGTVKLDVAEEPKLESNSELLKSLLMTSEMPAWRGKSDDNAPLTPERSENSQIPKLSTSMRRSEKIPKTSILEERLKEPPKIEIPIPEVSPRLMDTPTTPKTSLLIQRDSRTDTKTMYQKMLDSPKGERIEPKISDTPRKDMDKHDFENVGSPRIILKIAKSAIADCGEPRSPKSPKIRSAANSPNPEDSPGQKLGKIKLKLSRGGHPSIISNDHFDEFAQRHTEAILSPSHIGMKIKLSRTGDASIIQPDKHDSSDEIKESKHKFDEVSPKRIESPLGMKIKLSKTGDPSIVQQDATPKRKDKLDHGQEIPKRTDSPIGMKIKLSKSGDASIIQPDRQETSEDTGHKEKYDIQSEVPKRTDSPIGVKIKLSKSGDTSILSSESCEEFKDACSKSRDKLSANQDIPKRTDSPLGMKFKLTKSGGASIIQPEKPEALEEFKEKPENVADITKRVESPIGMKIKLLKTGDASIIHPEKQEQDEHKESVATKHREKSEMQDIQKRTDSPIGMRIKVMRSGEASVLPFEVLQECQEPSSPDNENFKTAYEIPKRNESPIGMKIKLSKSGDASIIHPERQEFSDESKDSAGSSRGSLPSSQDGSKASESPLGMKIKLSKTGDASIIHPGISPECKDSQSKRIEKLQEGPKRTDSPLGMKIKLSKTGDASIIEPEKKEKLTSKQKEKLSSVQEVSHKRKETEFPIEMKIKLSKTGHPTIIANEKQESSTETHSKSKEHPDGGQSTYQKRTEPTSPVKDPQLRIFKTGHSTIIQSSRSEVTIEPIQMSNQQKPESSLDIPSKCNDVTISPVDVKKSKLEAKLSQILPEVTIQPVSQMSGEPKQIMIDKKSGSISRQQMSVINQEISITQVPPTKSADLSMSGKLKEILRKNATNSPANSDCEIIEHRPELIIVNENSNSSQDIMIIEEVKAPVQEVRVPRKRGRPKRSCLQTGPTVMRQLLPMPKDPLALDIMQQSNAAEHRETDRPKRTCRNQKSYAPPKRGRGRGRGKRKMDRADCAIGKIPRLEDPLTEIERSTLRLIAPLQPRIAPVETAQTSELYKALKQTPAERKRLISETLTKQGFPEVHKKLRLEAESDKQLAPVQAEEIRTVEQAIPESSVSLTADSKTAIISGMLQLSGPVSDHLSTNKLIGEPKIDIQEEKNIISEMATTEHQNWLTPSIKLPEAIGKTEAISMVQVMDEETRMSAESNSRSQTPARNISVPAVETVINEESQGSVLSTATTESEKVKVKNRRMEINFDPDEGPFTVDKIAEYEWPLDKKGDTFMIQEQISQYLGVKSFKRKYPDLKRRMVEMEERNFLRENGLVSEAMCDMGLTAICSTEVLDVMCSDFPDQYEEYRKHMREKQAKEHSKKQKELTAAANAERNRIDLAEMAVQSALSWNVNFNKARKESRKYSLDLQSFTIHVPKKQLKVDVEKKPSNYPVALIPGQYTDYYREYTPAELRYYPLNTVLYGPMRPNERKFDSQSEGSQSDSDSDSSSDDSSSSSSEGTQDTEESQSTVDEVEIEAAANNKEENKNLKCKMCLKHLNKHGKAEVLIQCGTCNGNVHPSCIDLTLDMVPHIQGYSWQCTDCKTCVQCHNPADEDKMLFCDMCDRGYHIYCVGLRRVPQGRWHCRECAVCASCGLRQPGGANSDRNSVAQWQHEYKKGERNTRVYVSTLCVPCSKLWRKGRYCPHCSRCHSAQRLDLEPNLVHCGACDKYLHLGCVEIRYGTIDRKNYICECCSTPNQQHSSRPLMSKSFRT